MFEEHVSSGFQEHVNSVSKKRDPLRVLQEHVSSGFKVTSHVYENLYDIYNELVVLSIIYLRHTRLPNFRIFRKTPSKVPKVKKTNEENPSVSVACHPGNPSHIRKTGGSNTTVSSPLASSEKYRPQRFRSARRTRVAFPMPYTVGDIRKQ